MKNTILFSLFVILIISCSKISQSPVTVVESLSKSKVPVVADTIIAPATSASASTGGTYYVDPSSVSAISNGTLANPWKTIAQVNAGTTVLKPGDKVLFKRGQSYSGRLTVSSSGTAGNPIVYGNYGTGNLPEFNNATTDIIRIYNKQ